MSEPQARGLAGDNRYEIRVQGHLDAHWDDWFEGLTITNEADGTTTLSGVVIDQARLHGLLGKIGGLGMTLISFNAIGNQPT
ncbi:MAG: hypothetical protein JWQ68_2160 [Cryobacterium sp.]|jgi:hypothetical protein|nr:hypothetical protein [Cryobacterium sp.]